MIELILSTLAEFGLIREDYKHHKRITIKEKEDGIKRPIQKYFLQPSSVLLIVLIVVFSISTFLFFTYQRTSIFSDNTKKELAEISTRMEEWKQKYGQYPTELKELIGNNPIRQTWIKDSWKKPYKFIVSQNRNEFIIISAGPDRQFETEDDIRASSK